VIGFVVDILGSDKEGVVGGSGGGVGSMGPLAFSSGLGDQSGYFKKSGRPVY